MEQLKYIIEDSTIVELLGVQNFTNKESAILELVKNAFDAKATKLKIKFGKDSLTIADNGDGMNEGDIKRHWMHVGKSDKEYEIVDKNNKKRVLAGSKGIGRFALSRLGYSVELFSQKNNGTDNSVLWTTDWSRSLLTEKDKIDHCGTEIIINGLRDKWNKSSIDKVAQYLSRTYNDTSMKIVIEFENESIEVETYFKKPQLSYNCSSIINFCYSSENNILECEVNSDEFLPQAKALCGNIDIKYFKAEVDVFDELESNKKINLASEDLKNLLNDLGDFSAELYFSLKEPSTKDAEKFLYKDKILLGRYDHGVILYRNSFSISSYDGTKDWIGLGKRSRLSPAAATHPTGSWRVRENQLSGKVVIDKKKNHLLEDMSNRQGLNENIYYEIFVKILDIGIATFERYRQSIIRRINVKNKIEDEREKNIVDKIIKNPTVIKDLSMEEVNKFISEVKEFKKENSDFKKEMHSTEERYKYDVRILNVLATSGLKATSIAHEMHNDRNSIADNCDAIISAMKEFGIWDFVNEDARTRYAYSNIPELINKNKRVNSKMVSFMDTMLTEVEKSHFIAEEHDVQKLLIDIKSVWERDYAWVEIISELSQSMFYTLPGDVLKVVFDNLILNSIQQNDDRNHLIINIKTMTKDGLLEFLYKDNGKGLNKKYIDQPMKILEVHETSRKRGHGLGMWIVNNTVVMSGGEILKIEGTDGFAIHFTVGGKM